MRYLLDTHVWLWLLSDPKRLGAHLALLENEANELFLSAASSWEIAIKYSLGRLPLPEPPESYVPSRMRMTGVTPLPVEHSHVLAVAGLPHHHRDPFDRLLIAQALVLDVTLVTADQAITAYGGRILLVN